MQPFAAFYSLLPSFTAFCSLLYILFYSLLQHELTRFPPPSFYLPPSNMAYMTRLGLWGQGTSFPEGFDQFHRMLFIWFIYMVYLYSLFIWLMVYSEGFDQFHRTTRRERRRERHEERDTKRETRRDPIRKWGREALRGVLEFLSALREALCVCVCVCVWMYSSTSISPVAAGHTHIPHEYQMRYHQPSSLLFPGGRWISLLI